jgi:hypothetical protein
MRDRLHLALLVILEPLIQQQRRAIAALEELLQAQNLPTSSRSSDQ